MCCLEGFWSCKTVAKRRNSQNPPICVTASLGAGAGEIPAPPGNLIPAPPGNLEISPAAAASSTGVRASAPRSASLATSSDPAASAVDAASAAGVLFLYISNSPSHLQRFVTPLTLLDSSNDPSPLQRSFIPLAFHHAFYHAFDYVSLRCDPRDS